MNSSSVSTQQANVQLQQSINALKGFTLHVKDLKDQSGALSGSVKSLAKDYLNQRRHSGTQPRADEPMHRDFSALQNYLSQIYNKANTLKGALNDVLKETAKPNTTSAKETAELNITLVRLRQNPKVFECLVGSAQDLLATVPPSDAALWRNLQKPGDLVSALEVAQNSINAGVKESPDVQQQFKNLKAAAIHLRDQIQVFNKTRE